MYNILYNTLSMIYTHKHIHNQMKKKYTITVFISVTEQHGYSYYLQLSSPTIHCIFLCLSKYLSWSWFIISQGDPNFHSQRVWPISSCVLIVFFFFNFFVVFHCLQSHGMVMLREALGTSRIPHIFLITSLWSSSPISLGGQNQSPQLVK